MTMPRRRRREDTPSTPARLSPIDILALGLIGLRTRPLRAAVPTLGIAVGITTLVLIVGISDSSNAALNDRLDALGANLLLAEGQAVNNVPTQLVPDAQAVTLRIGPVTAAAALGPINEPVRRNARIPTDDVPGLNAYAASPTLAPVLHARMQAGVFLDDQTSDMRAVVLGQAAAANLGIDATSLIDHPAVEIGTTAFAVIGILDALPVTSNLDYGVFVGWNVARAALHFDGLATTVYLRAPTDQLTAVSDVLGASLFPAAPGLVNVSQPSTALAAKQAVNHSASGLVLGLVAIALIVGGIGIANTMYLAVIERRHEIGLRRALGATRGHIRMQFLIEAVALAMTGATVGAALGVIGTAVYALSRTLPVAVSPLTVGAGVLGGLVVGAVAGLYPAMRAARLTPTQSLAST